MTSIGNYAFSGCTSLTDITIPDIVTSIGAYAFESCKLLSSIIIPNSVISIDAYAFKDCALTILCEATTKPLGWSILWNIGNDSVVWGYKGI